VGEVGGGGEGVGERERRGKSSYLNDGFWLQVAPPHWSHRSSYSGGVGIPGSIDRGHDKLEHLRTWMAGQAWREWVGGNLSGDA